MKKQLFFDDSQLFGRDNVKRVYMHPEKIAEYKDGVCSTDFCTANVFKLDDGRYRMLYFGHSAQFSGKRLFSAISEDGINLSPERIRDAEDGVYSHEVMQIPRGSEVATVIDTGTAKERYKLLMSEFDDDTYSVNDPLYVSDDLLSWTLKSGVSWGDKTEPLASAFYNKHKRCYTIVLRPFWGVRTVGCKNTTDFQSFTEYRNILGVDSCDGILDELYGMLAFEYDGNYIGIPHMYRGLKSEYSAKYKNGIIDTQLAYSLDGDYWKRSLREPFLSGGEELPLLWVASVLRREDGVYLYGSASECEHGTVFNTPGDHGRICVYKLRTDGFIALKSENSHLPSRVITREKIWNGGNLHININAKNVTVGVFVTEETESVGLNALGKARPIEGFTAADCIPFSGDSVDCIPRFKSGRTLDELVGKTLVFEINFEDGTLFSLYGSYTDVFNTEGARYRKFGAMPARAEAFEV